MKIYHSATVSKLFSQNSGLLSIVQTLLWSLFLYSLYRGMFFLTKLNLFTRLTSSSDLGKQLSQIFGYLLISSGLLVVTTILYEHFYFKKKLSREKDFLFTVLFTILLFPLEYLIIQVLYVIIRDKNMIVNTESNIFIFLLLTSANFLQDFIYKSKIGNKDLEPNAWNRTAGRLWAKMLSYFAVEFMAALLFLR